MKKGFNLQLALICTILSLGCAFWLGYYFFSPGMMLSQSNFSMRALENWPRDKWIITFINRGLRFAVFFQFTLFPLMFFTYRSGYKRSIGDKVWIRLFKIITGGIFVGFCIPILPSVLMPYFSLWTLIPFSAALGGLSMLAIILSSAFFSSLRI